MIEKTHPGIVAVMCLFASVAAGAEEAAKTEKPRLAVADLKVVGDVGVKDAGPFVAELVLGHFDTKKYQLVGRAELVKILAAHKLKMAELVSSPAAAGGKKKIKGVRYVVVGSIVKLGDLKISAQLVDVTTGGVGPMVRVSASATDARDLDAKLRQLAAGLAGKRPAAMLAKTRTIHLGGAVTMKLVLIPAGRFVMGSPQMEEGRRSNEGPQRTVTISQPFYMGVYEVTRKQFERFASGTRYRTEAEKQGFTYIWRGRVVKASGVSWRKPPFEQTDAHPVICLSWKDAVAYCQWLTRKSGRTCRLPTEAEWEYACRAGTTTPFHMGGTIDSRQANYDSAAIYGRGRKGLYRRKTTPVATFKPNLFGLYDMHGNALEWCGNWLTASYRACSNVDPKGVKSGTLRVLRGGSWNLHPATCRSAMRSGYAPSYRGWDFGLRVVVPVGRAGVSP